MILSVLVMTTSVSLNKNNNEIWTTPHVTCIWRCSVVNGWSSNILIWVGYFTLLYHLLYYVRRHSLISKGKWALYPHGKVVIAIEMYKIILVLDSGYIFLIKSPAFVKKISCKSTITDIFPWYFAGISPASYEWIFLHELETGYRLSVEVSHSDLIAIQDQNWERQRAESHWLPAEVISNGVKPGYQKVPSYMERSLSST